MSSQGRRKLIVLLIIALAGLGLYYFLSNFQPGNRQSTGKEEAAQAGHLYFCPMHPDYQSDKQGDCPICFMKLVEQKPAEVAKVTGAKTTASPGKNIFICPMHPQIISDKPGDCPICGMKLVEREESEKAATEPTAGPSGLAPVTVNESQKKQMGLAFGAVGRQRITKEIRTSARIVPDETRLYRVTTKIEGYIDKLYVNVTGQAVRKGQPLFTVYSPELVASQQEFITSLPFAQQLANSSDPTVSASGKRLRDAARKRLKLWDISDGQIDRLEKTGQVEKHLTLYAPAGGYVIEKHILAGQKIMPGEALLVIADLFAVWAEADIYESDIPYVKEGMPVTLTLSYWPGKSFRGEVSFLYPYLDAQTRTLKARLNIENPELLLKAEMYADAHLVYDLGEKLALPEGALMQTGTRSYVFVAGDGDEIRPVEVTVGTRSEGYYELLSGLEAGDRVVTSANFLVDSESSLKAALQSVTGGVQ
jgi:multidrug efflux pump subunit AcrA (membrane-fusion protein)